MRAQLWSSVCGRKEAFEAMIASKGLSMDERYRWLQLVSTGNKKKCLRDENIGES